MASGVQELACHHCGAMFRRVALGPGESARCVRCDSVLETYSRFSAGEWLAIVVATGIVFVLANAYPEVTLFVQGKESHRAVSNQIFDVIHGILVKIFNPEGEKLFPVIQKTVRRYEELRQKEEELQGLIDGGAGTWIFASGKTGDSENCL